MEVSLTCPVEICTVFETFPDAALRISRKCCLDVVHLDPSGHILALQKQAVDKYLEFDVMAKWFIKLLGQALYG
jgi:hypothetical protein